MYRLLILSLALLSTPALAGYSPETNYMLNCMGCHLADGLGSEANHVPRVKDTIGYYLRTADGRDYLMRVPGAALSRLEDDELAAVLNYMINTMAGTSKPADFKPFTGEEIKQHRYTPLLHVGNQRRMVLQQLEALGIKPWY